jgi:hypothetical protein
MKRWVFSPHSGGKTIPGAVHERIRKRVLDRVAKYGEVGFGRVEVSFRGRFCYVDAFQEPANPHTGGPDTSG